MNKKRLEESRESLNAWLVTQIYEPEVRTVIEALVYILDALLEEEPCERKCCREK